MDTFKEIAFRLYRVGILSPLDTLLPIPLCTPCTISHCRPFMLGDIGLRKIARRGKFRDENVRGVWCKEYSFLEIICPSVSYLSNNSFNYFILKLYHIRTIRACVFSTNIRGKKARESYSFVRLSFIIRKVSFLFLLWKRNSLKYNFQKLDSFVYRSFVQLCSCKKILEFRPNIEMYFY